VRSPHHVGLPYQGWPGEQRPYDDGLDEEGLLNYRYRGTDPRHRDNVGLRLTMQRRTPLIYLCGVVRGEYMPVWPVFIVGDDPSALTFKVTIDDRQLGLVNAVAPPRTLALLSVCADLRHTHSLPQDAGGETEVRLLIAFVAVVQQ
jgi:hypothetical protein